MAPTVVSVAGRRVLDVLAALGYRVVLLDEDIPLEVALAVDVPLEADLTNWDAAEAAVRRVHAATPVEAVLSVRDSYVPLAGYLAARLGVRGLALHAALNCHDKARMRRALDGAGLATPRYRLVDDAAEAVTRAHEVGFPLVIKRTRGAGGAGVRLCRQPAEVQKAIFELTDPDELAPLLIEQFLDGPEYAVQTVTTNGRTEVLSILAEQIGPPPRFAETGYDFPSGLDGRRTHEVERAVESALAALGFDHGVAHVQLRLTVDGPRVIEVNPRPPGGLVTEVTEAVSGVNMVQAAVEATLGRPISRGTPTATHVRYRCVVFDEPGWVDFDPAALSVPTQPGTADPLVSLDIDPGDQVLPVDHPDGGVYGRVVVFGEDAHSVEQQYHAVCQRLALRFHPR